MLSSRGALTIDAVLNECIGRSATASSSASAGSPARLGRVGGAAVLPLTEAQKVWNTVGAFLRSQMLLGNAITIPKFCSFWCRQRLAATQGNVNFYVREVCFGLCQSFVTTYNLNPMVAIEDPKIKYTRLPMDIIASEARVPADVCAAVLRELALFVGEGTFNGKSFHLSFPSVVDVQLKRERTFVAPCQSLVAELFAIDSRKWPTGIREIAAASVFEAARPSSSASSSSVARARSSSSSRPRTNSSLRRPITAASAASSAGAVAGSVVAPPRPLFVTALTQNKTFEEIEKAPPKEIRHAPRLPGAKGRAALLALRNGGAVPLPASASSAQQSRHADPLAPRPLSAQHFAEEHEEESVYDVLSPSRQAAARMNTQSQQQRHHQQSHGHGYGHEEDAAGEDDYFGAAANGHYGDEEEGYAYEQEGIYGDVHEEGAAPSPLMATAAPPVDSRQQAAAFPLSDRTARANTHNNIFPQQPSPATPAGAPSCCKKLKAVFPWETALPEATPSEVAAFHYGDHPNHHHHNDENSRPATGASAASSSAAMGPGGRRRHFVHPAEQTSAKGLLYDNMYMQ